MEYLISQFADDTSIDLDGSRESFQNVIKILTEFANWSGLNINYAKSQVVWVGSQKGSATVFLPHLKSSGIQRDSVYWALYIQQA